MNISEPLTDEESKKVLIMKIEQLLERIKKDEFNGVIAINNNKISQINIFEYGGTIEDKSRLIENLKEKIIIDLKDRGVL